jgi:uncharacterized membrane protein
MGMNTQRMHRNTWIGLGVVLLLALLIVSALGGEMMGRGSMVGYGARSFIGAGPWLWGFGLIGLVMRLAIWGVLILLVVTLFRRFSRPSDNEVHYSDLSSLEILRRRYAGGEISRGQFDEMRQVLDPTPAAQ